MGLDIFQLKIFVPFDALILSLTLHRVIVQILNKALFNSALGTDSKKKNYEILDICPNWVYPTYLVA